MRTEFRKSVASHWYEVPATVKDRNPSGVSEVIGHCAPQLGAAAAAARAEIKTASIAARVPE